VQSLNLQDHAANVLRDQIAMQIWERYNPLCKNFMVL